MSIENQTFIPDLPSDDYFALDAVSCSLLKRMECPCKAFISKPPTPAMALGTAVHAMVLEPEKNLIAVAPEINRRTKAGKEEWAKFQEGNKDKIVITAEVAEKAKGMADSVMSHAVARDLFTNGNAEQTVTWTDVRTGEKCKARLDWWRNDNVVVDLKTASNAHPGAFAKASYDLKYHWQDAFYTEGAQADNFIFVVVESEEPYVCEVYQLTTEAKQLGKFEIEAALDTYHACRMFDDFTGGYNGEDKLTIIDLPGWAYR